MKQFWKILKFELKQYFTNKVFVGITVFLALLIAVVMFFPKIRVSFGETEAPSTDGLPEMIVVSDSKENEEFLKGSFGESFPGYRIVISNDSDEAIREKIVSGEAECAFVLKSLTEYTYYVNNLSLYDENTYIADSVLQSAYQYSAMTNSGMSSDKAIEAMSVQIVHETETLGKDQAQNFFYTYIMIFALYMVILLYGQMVATNVATEKSSRAMELLVTSAKPVSMMFGKVIASCTAGLVQLVAIFGTALVCFNINKADWSENPIVSSIFGMPVDLFVYMIVFFLLGFFIYAFMYGAVGSTASKLEDINTAVMPITMLFVVAFIVVVTSMTSGSVDNLLMKVCSFIPFTSPMAMFTRIAMSSVPVHEIAISIVILAVSVVGIGIAAAKIYRVGVLLYGTKPNIKSIIKALKKS